MSPLYFNKKVKKLCILQNLIAQEETIWEQFCNDFKIEPKTKNLPTKKTLGPVAFAD